MAACSLNCLKVSRILFNSVNKNLKPVSGIRWCNVYKAYGHTSGVVKIHRETSFKFCTAVKYSYKGFHASSSRKNEKLQKAEEKSEEQSEQKKTEDGANEDKKSRSNFVVYSTYATGASLALLGTYVIYYLGSPKVDENGKVIEDEFSSMPFFQQFYHRLGSEIYYYKKMTQEPSRDKLLPDPLTYPYVQPPYTLILELRDLLVHPEWTYQTGWRFKKRPGVDHFLEQVAPPLFEIVIFTAEQGMSAFPIIDALDPNGYVMYRLVRDATHFVDGHHVKDLSCLNRDLKKVIVVDWNPESVKFHRSNSLIVPQWKGNDDDLMLVDLAAFLRTIAIAKVDDVRETLEYYQQFDNPVEAFRENQRKLMEQLEEKQRLEKEKPNLLTTRGSWSPSFLNRKPQ